MTGRAWRLTYQLEGQKRVSSWVFLEVREALEHCRLNGILKFRLEDKPIKAH